MYVCESGTTELSGRLTKGKGSGACIYRDMRVGEKEKEKKERKIERDYMRWKIAQETHYKDIQKNKHSLSLLSSDVY